MMLPKFREIKEALRSFFSPPYTSAFPAVAVIPPEGFRGKPQFYEEDCVGCLACLEVCPARAIEYSDDKPQRLRTLTHHQDVCIYCQQCERACITDKGIILTREYNLATEDRRQAITQSRKKLVLCDHCGEIIAPLDHLRWLSLRVGHLLYANPTLLLARHAELGLIRDLPVKSSHPRAGHLTFLCPNCRRQMIIKEQW